MTETVKVMDRETPCLKLEWRATGLWSVFWCSDYWFRASDGVSVRFCMPGGGEPRAKSELVAEKK
jgi:hypothetical protein